MPDPWEKYAAAPAPRPWEKYAPNAPAVRGANPVGTMKAAPRALTPAWFKEKFYTAADEGSQGLPAAGATVGAYIGATGGAVTAPVTGPGAVPLSAAGAIGGAGIGGMAGEATRQLVRRGFGFESPGTSRDAANRIAIEGAVQGGVEATTAGMGRMALPLRRLGATQFRRALDPTTLENKAIAEEIAPELMRRGVRGTTESIEKRAGTEIRRLRPNLEGAYATLPRGPVAARSPISKTINELHQLKGRYFVDGEVVNPQAVNAIEGVQQIIEKHGNSISPQSLRRVKQIFDEAVSEAGGYTTNDLTTNYSLKAQKEAANTIRRILHDAHPNVAVLDREMSFWLDVQQVARATNIRRMGQQGGLTRTVALPLVGAAAGAMIGGGQNEASAATVLSAVAFLAVRHPRWRTASAVIKDRMADALARGDVRAVTGLAARIGIAQSELSRVIQETMQSAQPVAPPKE